jgi:hypothetical protein
MLAIKASNHGASRLEKGEIFDSETPLTEIIDASIVYSMCADDNWFGGDYHELNVACIYQSEAFPLIRYPAEWVGTEKKLTRSLNDD